MNENKRQFKLKFKNLHWFLLIILNLKKVSKSSNKKKIINKFKQ